jgi:hypothetical protein
MTQFIIKGPSGLGDAIYLYPVVKWYTARYDKVIVRSFYPELFQNIKNVEVEPFRAKGDINLKCSYTKRKYTAGTSQFEDIVIGAEIKEALDFKIDWEIKNKGIEEIIRKEVKGKKVCIITAPYEPFAREDKWGKLLRIKSGMMQTIVDKYRDKVFFIQVGGRFTLTEIKGTQLNLINKISVSDLIDLVCVGDIGLSQIGNMLPICESLGKKNFLFFAETGLKCDNKFISSITPEKIIHYKHLNCSVVDTEPIKNVLRKFYDFIRL